MRKILLNPGSYLRFLLSGGIDKKRFKILASYMAVYGMHKSYEFVLNKYDPDLLLNTASQGSEKQFVGVGYGANTLNSYRKMKVGEKIFFEKIFFKDSTDFKKCVFFYDHIKEQVQEKGIMAPELYKIEEGSKLAVAYFEFLNLEKCESARQNDLNRALEITSKLGEVTVPKEFEKEAFLQDFSSDPMFKDRLELIVVEMNKRGTNNKRFLIETLKKIEKEKRQLQHGDLFSGNFTEKYVIDWDRLGYYPFGYDIGLALAFHHLRDLEEINPEIILDEIDKIGIQEPEEVLSIYFFAVIFLTNRNKTNEKYNYNELFAYLQKIKINEDTGLYA